MVSCSPTHFSPRAAYVSWLFQLLKYPYLTTALIDTYTFKNNIRSEINVYSSVNIDRQTIPDYSEIQTTCKYESLACFACDVWQLYYDDKMTRPVLPVGCRQKSPAMYKKITFLFPDRGGKRENKALHGKTKWDLFLHG